ncbi:NUDIX hydrolase [Viridibacterium curvum]|uniref:NUDIX domain-containing protein n=1 Tax=Viridibacterium curvum TaxID=1101404 RepID=A0ABP9QGY1_9RHOO
MPAIICTVDVVLLTLEGNALKVALFQRDKEPFKNTLALPGGFIHEQEDQDAQDAAARMLRDKTGIASPYLEQLACFSGRGRDPRGWSVSIAYYALVPAIALTGIGASGGILTPVERVKGLPFDHADIVRMAVERVRAKSTYSSLPVHLCGEQFTLPQLQAVYETILGEPINKVSFRRKMEELDILEPIAGAMESGKAHRPAQLYQLKRQFLRQLSLTDRGLNSGST